MITLEQAKEHLKAWLDAELGVTTAQSYRIGNRTIERPTPKDIREGINYWRKEVARLSGKSKKVGRIIPRDF